MMAIFLPYPEVKSREQLIREKLAKKNKNKKKNKQTTEQPAEENQDSSSASSEVDLERGELADEVASQHIDPKECAVIIPTHNSAMVITETIQAAARYVPYKNIFIMDNGPKRTEANLLTEKVVREISTDINYYFFPIPSKAVNLYLGSVVASSFQYMFVLDDDTIFPEGFCWPSLPKGKTTASGFSICAVNSKRNRDGVVVKLQDWEYKIAGYRKYVQARTSSTFFHHGAIGFWKREAYQETWKKHYALPLGDDRLSGMQNLFLGNRMDYVASQTPFQTIVPEQYVWAKKGTFWTVFKQRAFRWNVTNFRHLWMDIWLFFTYIPRRSTVTRTILGALIFRLFLILELASLYVTINMPIAWVFLLHYRWRWWLIIHAALFVSSILQGLFSNYVIMRKRPDLRVEWWILFITPVYRFTLRWFRLLGVIASALVYIPLYPHPQKVDERPEVRAVLKALEITGERIQATLPEEMDKYTEAELRLRAEAREALADLKEEFDMSSECSDSESLPPVARASGKTSAGMGSHTQHPEDIAIDIDCGHSDSEESDQGQDIEPPQMEEVPPPPPAQADEEVPPPPPETHLEKAFFTSNSAISVSASR